MSTAPVLGRDCESLTVDDWLTRDDIPERSELFQGVLIVAPPPDADHQAATTRIAGSLLAVGDREGGIALVAPTGVTLERDVGFEPDVLYLTASRIEHYQKRKVNGPPDIAVEVASPSTRRFDRLTKLPTYLELGVREVWLIDLQSRTVEVHEPDQEPRVCSFGEPIPSRIVDVGSASLERLPVR